MICPKCGGDLSPKTSSDKRWCLTCNGHVFQRDCVACGAAFCSLIDEQGEWHNHQCDPKREKKIEDSRRASEEPRDYTPSYRERLAEGFRMMQDRTDD